MVLAYGAAAHRGLGVPGEEVAGVHAARELVEWYNGHPHAAEARFDLAGAFPFPYQRFSLGRVEHSLLALISS